MARYIGPRDDQSVAALEARVHRLEVRVNALTEELRVLARELEDPPAARPGQPGRPADDVR